MSLVQGLPLVGSDGSAGLGLQLTNPFTHLVQNSFLSYFLGVCNCFWADKCLEEILQTAITVVKKSL